MAVEINDAQFQKEVLESDLPVLVDFWAPWCGPCRMLAPILEDIAREYHGKLKVVKINVDENQAVAGSYGIMSIPTLICFKDGKMVGKVVGALPKEALKEYLSQWGVV